MRVPPRPARSRGRETIGYRYFTPALRTRYAAGRPCSRAHRFEYVMRAPDDDPSPCSSELSATATLSDAWLRSARATAMGLRTMRAPRAAGSIGPSAPSPCPPAQYAPPDFARAGRRIERYFCFAISYANARDIAGVLQVDEDARPPRKHFCRRLARRVRAQGSNKRRGYRRLNPAVL